MSEHAGARLRAWGPDLWVALLVAVLTFPMWIARGGGLARDLIFTPDRPWTLDTIGMGGAAPRAVPLDSFLSLTTGLLGGEVVFRLCVAGVLLAAGLGAVRAVADLPPAARAVPGTFAVWNPFVVERVAMGQWALLSAYAALFWLVPRWRQLLSGGGGWSGTALATVAAALTPTGAVIVLGTCLTTVAVSRPRHQAGRLVLLALAVQLPWLTPSLLGGHAATSDPAAVEAFAARGGSTGVAVALAAGGGIWNPFATPGSMQGWYAVVVAMACVTALVVGLRRWWRDYPGLVVAAAGGLVLASAASLPGGATALAWAVAHVPGAGLLRDGQKWAMPFVVLLSLSWGVLAARVLERARKTDAAPIAVACLALAPVVAVPDGAATTWDALRPVRYPAELAAVIGTLDAAPEDSGAVVSLPWASYRRYPWGLDVSAADPVSRWTSRPAIVSDALVTQGGELTAEDPRARAVAAVLAGPESRLDQGLAELGVGWVSVLHGTDPQLDERTASAVARLDVVSRGETVSLYRVSGSPHRGPAPSAARVALVVAAHLLWAMLGVAALVTGISRRLNRRNREM